VGCLTAHPDLRRHFLCSAGAVSFHTAAFGREKGRNFHTCYIAVRDKMLIHAREYLARIPHMRMLQREARAQFRSMIQGHIEGPDRGPATGTAGSPWPASSARTPARPPASQAGSTTSASSLQPLGHRAHQRRVFQPATTSGMRLAMARSARRQVASDPKLLQPGFPRWISFRVTFWRCLSNKLKALCRRSGFILFSPAAPAAIGLPLLA
jgi:hypothetical protein